MAKRHLPKGGKKAELVARLNLVDGSRRIPANVLAVSTKQNTATASTRNGKAPKRKRCTVPAISATATNAASTAASSAKVVSVLCESLARITSLNVELRGLKAENLALQAENLALRAVSVKLNATTMMCNELSAIATELGKRFNSSEQQVRTLTNDLESLRHGGMSHGSLAALAAVSQSTAAAAAAAAATTKKKPKK